MPTSLYATSGALGVALGVAWSESTSALARAGDQPPLPPGTRVIGNDGSEWVAVTLGTGGVTGDGYTCVYDEDFLAVMLSTSTGTYGMQCGVPACGAAEEDDVVWLQIAGSCAAIQVAASAAANVDLVPTATAGQLDDGVTTGNFVKGLVLTTARSATDGTAPGVLNFPVIDVLYEPET